MTNNVTYLDLSPADDRDPGPLTNAIVQGDRTYWPAAEVRGYIAEERARLANIAASLDHADMVVADVAGCGCRITARIGEPFFPNMAPDHRCGR